MLRGVLEGSKRYRRLPTAVIGKVWSTFHKLRFSPKIQDMWKTYITTLNTPSALQNEQKLLLQLLLDRLMKHHIATEASACSTAAAPEQQPLTSREQNAVRYMAGYVVRKMKNKFKERSKQPDVQKKRDLFICVLSTMESTDEDESIPSLDYTCEWVEMINREGLCCVNNDVYKLMELIEIQTKRYLQPDGVQQAPDQSVQEQIVSSIMNDRVILSSWDNLASSIPPRYEACSLELLRELAVLWTTVRCFSFAKSWNDKTAREKFKKHDTRKSLKCSK